MDVQVQRSTGALDHRHGATLPAHYSSLLRLLSIVLLNLTREGSKNPPGKPMVPRLSLVRRRTLIWTSAMADDRSLLTKQDCHRSPAVACPLDRVGGQVSARSLSCPQSWHLNLAKPPARDPHVRNLFNSCTMKSGMPSPSLDRSLASCRKSSR